jgi:hypothetical protein
LSSATQEQIDLVDSIYAECEAHYNAGGDSVVECFEPQEVLNELKTLEGAREYCGLKIQQAANARWGEDSDPEVQRLREFDDWMASRDSQLPHDS